jgi:hypothetical protein
MLSKHDKLKQLHKTIDTIVKARNIQKSRIDANVMREEMTQEELERFHRPMVDQLASIVDTTKSQPTTLLPIEGPTPNPVQSIQGIKDSAHEVFDRIEGPSTTLISIEHTSKESSKRSKESSKASFKASSKESLNIFYPDEGIDEDIV